MKKRPLIGLTLDLETAGSYSSSPWYALRANYCEAVAAAGGIPIALPHMPQQVDAYLRMIDGLLITGGAFDVDPTLYGVDTRHDTILTKDSRTRFEMALLKGALALELPLLGICGGEQLLAVALGGTLIQHLPDEVSEVLEHEQTTPRDQPGHAVEIIAGTLLRKLTACAEMTVNSAHHQAVGWVPDNVRVNARAPDGVIEGIEYPEAGFCVGIQWHPEYHVDPADAAILRGLVDACR